MATNSKDSWQVIKTLKEGILGLHKTPRYYAFLRRG